MTFCTLLHTKYSTKLPSAVIQAVMILACIQEVSSIYLNDYTDWFSSLPPGK